MRKRGFTLVELLTVIAIIAILAAILFPVFAWAREFARRHTCLTNLSQLGIALRMYARDYDGQFPPRDHDLTPLVRGYLNGTTLLMCPSDANPIRQAGSSAATLPSPVQPINPGPSTISLAGYASSYQYRGGLRSDAPGDLPIAADWGFLHSDAADVLTVSGAARPVVRGHWIPVAPGPPPGLPTHPSQYDTPYFDAKTVRPSRKESATSGARR